MQIIYHGHSFIEIETEQWSILIDPFVTGNTKCDLRLEDLFLKNITHILLTHGHSDHVGDTIAITKHFSDCIVVGMVELLSWLISKEVNNTESVNIGGTYRSDYFSAKFFRADHSSSTPDGEYAGLAAGIIVYIWDKKIYHAGDTSLFADMRQLANEHLDVAYLPIGDRYTMWIGDAVTAASYIGAKTIVPIHYNTWSIIQADDMEFARQIMLGQYGVPKVLRAGQYIVL